MLLSVVRSCASASSTGPTLRRAGMKHGKSLAVLGWTARQPCLPLDVPADTTLQCFTLEGFDDIGRAVNELGDLHWAQLIGGAA
jgi:hypothetical protein